jgi:hypothetical protein
VIDLPIGKALVVEEKNKDKSCEGCDLAGYCKTDERIGEVFVYELLACFQEDRKDGKSVRFKLVDYPPGEKQ